MLRQPEQYIRAFIVIAQKLGKLRPVFLLSPNHQIQFNIVKCARVVRRQSQAESIQQRLEASSHNQLAKRFITVGLIQKRER